MLAPITLIPFSVFLHSKVSNHYQMQINYIEFGLNITLATKQPFRVCLVAIYRSHRAPGRSTTISLATNTQWKYRDQPRPTDHKGIMVNPCDECVWASIKIAGAKELYLYSFYRPPSTSISSIYSLSEVTSRLYQKFHHGCPHLVIS